MSSSRRKNARSATHEHVLIFRTHPNAEEARALSGRGRKKEHANVRNSRHPLSV